MISKKYSQKAEQNKNGDWFKSPDGADSETSVLMPSLLEDSDAFSSATPGTPSDCGQVSDGSDFLEISFMVDLVDFAGHKIASIKCDEQTTAGFLVHTVREAYKKRGRELEEQDVTLVIGTKVDPVQRLSSKIFDLADCHDLTKHLRATVITPHPSSPDEADAQRLND